MMGLFAPVGVLLGAHWLLQQFTKSPTRPPAVPSHRSLSAEFVFAAIGLLNISVLSLFSPHKEYRFLLPSLPALFIALARGLESWVGKCKVTGGRVLAAVNIAVCLHLCFSTYMLRLHQGGAEAAVLYTTSIAAAASAAASTTSNAAGPFKVQLLAPCYSFPGYSFAHVRSSARIGSGTGVSKHCSDPSILDTRVCEAVDVSVSAVTTQSQSLLLSMPSCLPPQSESVSESEQFVHHPLEFLSGQMASFETQSDQGQAESRAGLPVDAIITFDCYFNPTHDKVAVREGSFVMWPNIRRETLSAADVAQWDAITEVYNNMYYVVRILSVMAVHVLNARVFTSVCCVLCVVFFYSLPSSHPATSPLSVIE